MLEFRVLGPLEVLAGGVPLPLGGPKQRAALAILLLGANRVVSVERLADDLYAGAPPVTAVTQVQRQVSELRKVLGATTIETRTPGYLLHVDREALDLERFEVSTADAARALEQNEPGAARDLLDSALGLWRGSPLADLAYEPFAQTAIARLEEVRLVALEQRVDADLALGRHTQVLSELEALVWEHPLRERLRGQLMLALYRSGRQAEALEAYRTARATLVEQFGIEPSRPLAELERRILKQDPGLDAGAPVQAAGMPDGRVVLVGATSEEQLTPLLATAEPFGRLHDRTVIVAHLLHREQQVSAASAALAGRSRKLTGRVRTAAFTSLDPARDLLRLAATYDVELVLVDGAASELGTLLEHSPCDVAAFHGGAVDWGRDGIYVPFGGGSNDWAALELAAWLASAADVPIKLVGTTADPSRTRRDASRLLADASIALQRVVGVVAEPVLAEQSAQALLAVVEPASLVAAGLPDRFRAEGLDATRTALVRSASPPVLLVQRGARPGGLAPGESRTRFSWSLEG
jgi:DNA-binding SARP family transcriptional activator